MTVRSEVSARSRGMCEVQRDGCWGQASQFHHRLRRSQGGKDDFDTLLHVCTPCHNYIHANPAISYQQGWLKRSGNG